MANPLVNEAIRRLIRAGYPEETARKIAAGELAMDEASRMARARDQGFDSGQVRYHATDSAFDAFDDAYLGRETAANVTDFSEGSFANNLAMLGHWTSDRPLAEALSRERSMPLMLRGRRQDFDSLEDLSDAVTNAGGVRAFQDDLLSDGFVGVNVRDEEFGGISQVTLNPADIRSTEAAFDPEQTGSSNILAGLGGAGVVGAGLMAPEEAEAGIPSAAAQQIVKRGRQAFLGRPKITSARNASDLRPRAGVSAESAPEQPFLDGLTVRHGEDGSAVFDGDEVVASYDRWNTLAVDPKYRRRGIATELIAQRRTMFPDQPPAQERTKAAQQAQEAAWDRIVQASKGSVPAMAGGAAIASQPASASPLDRPEASERLANLRAVQVASNTLERLRRERGAVMSPLQNTRMARFGDYLTENRPSEMDPVQRALQSLGLFQGLGEYLRTTGEGQRTTTMQDINAALDVIPL